MLSLTTREFKNGLSGVRGQFFLDFKRKSPGQRQCRSQHCFEEEEGEEKGLASMPFELAAVEVSQPHGGEASAGWEGSFRGSIQEPRVHEEAC